MTSAIEGVVALRHKIKSPNRFLEGPYALEEQNRNALSTYSRSA